IGENFLLFQVHFIFFWGYFLNSILHKVKIFTQNDIVRNNHILLALCRNSNFKESRSKKVIGVFINNSNFEFFLFYLLIELKTCSNSCKAATENNNMFHINTVEYRIVDFI